MKSHELRLYFPVAKMVIFDDTYWMPDKKWIRRWYYEFGRSLNFSPKDRPWWSKWFGVGGWQFTHKNDCDNFALSALDMSRRLYAQDQHKEQAPAIAMVIGRLPDADSVLHAMIAVIMDDGCYLIEPQADRLAFEKITAQQKMRIREVVV